jgi:ketosteroid isomerase-like protein
MSQENVESFKRGLEAGNRGDVETLLEELDPEVEWHSALHALLGGEQTVFRGHDGVREMLRDLNEAFGEIDIEISEIRDLGDQLVAIGRNRARGRGSGAETETPLALVTEVKNGKTISVARTRCCRSRSKSWTAAPKWPPRPRAKPSVRS